MPRTRAVPESEETNGRNGAGVYVPAQSPEPPEETNETRKMLAVLIMAGSVTDAEALYFAIPGSTALGWMYLLRTVEPVRRYVLDGDPAWTRTVIVTEYDPVPTPAGDCAEDALPLAARNPDRAKAKEQTNGSQD